MDSFPGWKITFAGRCQVEKKKPVIMGSDVRHMVKVLRIKPGDVVEILDGSGRVATATVTLEPRIIRTETAGPACLAVIMYKWGDLG